MSEYTFTLKFRLPDPQSDPGHFIDALFEAGCDDATIGTGLRGRIALDFTREAESAVEAITSAATAVTRAIPGATLAEASPDLVGLTEIAEIAGCSRQYMRKLLVSNSATFPDPVYEGTPSLWHLRHVLDWFGETQDRHFEATLMAVSEATMKINLAREVQCLPDATPSLFEDLMQSVEQMDDIVRGERTPSREFYVDAAQIKSIREATGLSQARLAALLDVQVSTLRNWEQGRREPSGPARTLLRALKNDPVNVLKAIA